MAEIVLSAADDGSHKFITVGDEVAIVLSENATTGFRWSARSSESLGPGPDSYTSVNSRRLIGAGMLRTFRFRALRQGDAQVALKLWREWEGESSVVQRFEVTFSIRPADDAGTVVDWDPRQ